MSCPSIFMDPVFSTPYKKSVSTQRTKVNKKHFKELIFMCWRKVVISPNCVKSHTDPRALPQNRGGSRDVRVFTLDRVVEAEEQLCQGCLPTS
jgi:hypothetical protein